MKKLVLTIAIVLMMGTTVFAQYGGGALRRSKEYEDARRSNNMRGNRNGGLMLPNAFGGTDDYDGQTGEPAPLGSGVAVLVGLGAAYLVGKRRKED